MSTTHLQLDGDWLKKRAFLADGAMGTALIEKGWDITQKKTSLANLDQPDLVKSIHQSHLNAGSEILSTNTFDLPLNPTDRKACLQASLDLVQAFKKPILLSLGPIAHSCQSLQDYKTLRSIDLSFQNQASAVLFETHSTSLELDWLLTTLKESPLQQPALLSLTLGENLDLLDKTPLKKWKLLLKDHPFQAFGLNCMPVSKTLIFGLKELESFNKPLFMQPNWAFPANPIDSKAYLEPLSHLNQLPIFMLGGCCGSHPNELEQISKFKKTLDSL